MTPTPKTIQIFLPGGDPRGLRVAEITTRIVQVIEVPRSRLDEFARLSESSQVGVYFLFGSGTEGDDPQVYIGQTGDLRARLSSHDSKKQFWQRALVLVSRTNSLTQTHALFLEWHCLKLATLRFYQTSDVYLAGYCGGDEGGAAFLKQFDGFLALQAHLFETAN